MAKVHSFYRPILYYLFNLTFDMANLYGNVAFSDVVRWNKNDNQFSYALRHNDAKNMTPPRYLRDFQIFDSFPKKLLDVVRIKESKLHI